MERDFIQEGIDTYLEKKEELIKKQEEERKAEWDKKFNEILEKFYGSNISEEEREKKIEDRFTAYYEKSLQDAENKKKQEISGRTYTSKEIGKQRAAGWLLLAALLLLAAGLRQNIWNNELLFKYKEMRADKTSDFTIDEKEMLDPITKDDLPEIKQAIKDYDGPYKYTFGGDRTDGTHNDYYRFDGGALIQVSDKELDPIERLVKEEVREITKDRVPVLKPKEAGNIGIKEGFGEPVVEFDKVR